MDILARKYIETRDAEIIEELYKLRLELRKLEKKPVWTKKPRSLRRGRKPAVRKTELPSRSGSLSQRNRQIQIQYLLRINPFLA
jgi:hypothetical protein